MLLSKNMLHSSMKNCMKKHTCVHGAIERGDAHVRALQNVQDGRVQVHVSVGNAGDTFAAPQVATAAQLHLQLRSKPQPEVDFFAQMGAFELARDGRKAAASLIDGHGQPLAPWPPAARRWAGTW